MTAADQVVLGALCAVALGAGLFFTRRASRHGAERYFTGDRRLLWWAIGLSNTATYYLLRAVGLAPAETTG